MSVLPSMLNPYGSLGLYYTSPPAWIAVRQRFTQFHRYVTGHREGWFVQKPGAERARTRKCQTLRVLQQSWGVYLRLINSWKMLDWLLERRGQS